MATTETSGRELREQVVEIIGAGALSVLEANGLTVVSVDAAEAYQEEAEREMRRLRTQVRALAEVSDVTIASAEILLVGGVPRVVATCPAGDAKQMAIDIGKAMAFFLRERFPPLVWTEGEDKMVVDPGAIEFAVKPEGKGAADGR